MQTTSDIFRIFSGQWAFERVMSGSQQARATGEAKFTPQKSMQLAYREEGMLKPNKGKALNFFRNYVYELANEEIRVYFGDGPQTGDLYQAYEWHENEKMLLPVATHVCSADLYDAQYKIMDDNHFTLLTSIKGPQKDYSIETDFLRLG